jgi:hypothetical protein
LFKPVLVRGKAQAEQRGDCTLTESTRKLKEMRRDAPKRRQFPIAPHVAQIPFIPVGGSSIARLRTPA